MLGLKLFGGCALIVALIFSPYACNSIECSVKADAMGIPHTYGPIQGCIVEFQGKKVPIGAVRP